MGFLPGWTARTKKCDAWRQGDMLGAQRGSQAWDLEVHEVNAVNASSKDEIFIPGIYISNL